MPGMCSGPTRKPGDREDAGRRVALSLNGRPPVTNVPRGKYLGKRIGDPPKDEASISSDVRPAVAGSTAVISVKCSSTKGRYLIRHRINRNDRSAGLGRLKLYWPH